MPRPRWASPGSPFFKGGPTADAGSPNSALYARRKMSECISSFGPMQGQACSFNIVDEAPP
jgi:hypothetical protein